MSWEDDAIEYAKWDSPELSELAMYDINDDPKVLYCRIHYDTLEKRNDRWNNAKWFVSITKIIRDKARKGPKLDDYVDDKSQLLSMGVRLFNVVKKAYNLRWDYVRLFRLGVKFNTQYFISEYKLTKQTKVTDPIKKKK